MTFRLKTILALILASSVVSCGSKSSDNKPKAVSLPKLEAKYSGYSNVWACSGKNSEHSNESLVVTLLKKDGTEEDYKLDVSRMVLKITDTKEEGYVLTIKGITNFPAGIIESANKNFYTVQDLRRFDANNVNPVAATYDLKINALIYYPQPGTTDSIIIDCGENKIIKGATIY